ncbi:MAG TPA: vitamin K epoxide reductase family protein [Chitinophagaceae bacterium]|nr:vitamin K epoxide reductase family protein [Chitinophagaceae bacterium]
MRENFNTYLPNVANAYIYHLGINLSKTTLNRYLTENPYYPSLYSLSSLCDRFNIPYEAVSVEKEHFEELHPPFIAYVRSLPTGKDFVLVTNTNNGNVNYIAGDRKEKQVPKKKFLSEWEQVAFIMRKTELSGEKDFAAVRKNEIAKTNKRALSILSAIFTCAVIFYLFLNSVTANFLWPAASLLAIKLAGLTFAVLLLVYEIDSDNTLVKNICSVSKRTNCDAVLHSKASRILGMNWSEVGFFYFSSTFLLLLFPGLLFTDKIFLIAFANCCAAPYILFSIYYQSKVVKQWCPLCLGVQAVLLAELIWGIINFWQHSFLPDLSFPALYLLPFTLLLLPIVLWYTVKPILLKAKDEPAYEAAYKRLLYNPETFNSLLQQQPAAPAGYESIGITIGNPDATNTIIKVCNPYCGPCAKAHPVLEEIIHRNNNIKLKVIFTATNEANDKRATVAKHLLSIATKQNPTQTEHALDDWYLAEKKDYAAFADKYPLNGELKQQEHHIELMKTWCDEAGITHTPTIFINGHRMPETYNIEELQHIL